MIEVNVDFPGADDLCQLNLPAVPRVGERLFYRIAGEHYWRVTGVEWNGETGTVLLDVAPTDPPADA